MKAIVVRFRGWLIRLLAGQNTVVMNCHVSGQIIFRPGYGVMHGVNVVGPSDGAAVVIPADGALNA